jgi:hypothetical protein
VVGAPGEDSEADGINNDPFSQAQGNDNASAACAAYVFSRVGRASNSESGDQLGMAVAVAGDTLAVASSEEDGSSTGIDGLQDNGASRAGAVYVFQ